MNVAYVRVSTVEQNEERQLEALQKFNIDKWFTEKMSAKNTNRPKLQEMLDFVRDGDTVFIHDFSRLARSTKDLLDIIEFLNQKNVHLVSNKENIDSSTPSGKLMLTVIGAIYEFERTNLLERQKEGIEIAKKNGKYKGRKKIVVNQDEWNALYDLYMKRKISKTQMCKEIGCSRPTFYKIWNEMYDSNKISAE